MSFKDTLDRHNDHNVVILPRLFKDRTEPVPGLYCEDCGKLIKWLDWPTAWDLIELGVEKLEMIPEEKKIVDSRMTWGKAFAEKRKNNQNH
jgi:hypothetical protein